MIFNIGTFGNLKSPFLNCRDMKYIVVFLFFIVCSVTAGAQGILFSEYRMFLEPNRIRSLQLSNPTEQVRTYDISVINKRMLEGGILQDVPDTVLPPFSIRQYIKVFPRVVTLAPGESQEVQLQLKVPADMPDGEYRSYLHFVPRLTQGADTSDLGNGMLTSIVMRVGAAIPLFYRNHVTLDQIKIGDVKIYKDSLGMDMIYMDMHRLGSSSAYVTAVVEYMLDGKPVKIAEKLGNGIYPEVSHKWIEFPVDLQNVPPGEPLKISLIDAEIKDKTVILTSKTIEVLKDKVQ